MQPSRASMTLREVSNINVPLADVGRAKDPARTYAPRQVTRRTSESPLTDRLNRDPTYCSEMIADITEMFLSREKKVLRDATYLHDQPEVNEKMRMILIDWLVDVHIKFKLHEETFFLAVDIVDRYLSLVKVTRTTLQLVGITALLIASKYEEIWPPEVKECIQISANTYTRDDIVKMERGICGALQFRLTVPTSFPFAARLLDVIDADDTLRNATLYFLEHAALDYKCLNYFPSQLANAAVVLGNVLIGSSDIWGSTLQHYSKAKYSDVKPCAQQLLEFVHFAHTTKYQAIRRKYNNLKYNEVAKLALPTTLPEM